MWHLPLKHVWLHATAYLYSTTVIEMFIGTSKYKVGSGSMCVMLALLLCRVIHRWHWEVSQQCARSACTLEKHCLGHLKGQEGSISAPGTRRASFFDHSPPVPVFAAPLTKQSGVPSRRI